MGDGYLCTYLLFPGAEALLCGYFLQVRKQFLLGSLCYCGGKCLTTIDMLFILIGWHASANKPYIYPQAFMSTLCPVLLQFVYLISTKKEFAFLQAVCTILAMLATLPLAQLFFFHILLIKKVTLHVPLHFLLTVTLFLFHKWMKLYDFFLCFLFSFNKIRQYQGL